MLSERVRLSDYIPLVEYVFIAQDFQAPLCINTCCHLNEIVKNCVIQNEGKVSYAYAAQNVDGKKL